MDEVYEQLIDVVRQDVDFTIDSNIKSEALLTRRHSHVAHLVWRDDCEKKSDSVCGRLNHQDTYLSRKKTVLNKDTTIMRRRASRLCKNCLDKVPEQTVDRLLDIDVSEYS
jgi:hypothetical protein